MHTSLQARRRRKRALFLVPAVGVTLLCQLSLASSATGTRGTATAVAATASVRPNPVSEVDCNGWSPMYKTVRQMSVTCVDPIMVVNGETHKFLDNGHYIGHDEPSVKFISSAPGSGNAMFYLMRVPEDPAKAPTPSGSVTNYGQLSPAPWFGLPLCDPKSFPQNPCTPNSDTNIGTVHRNAAGSAFLELQFYPPGYTPFIDGVSCSATKWCAALTIDSLTCNFAGKCNRNCIQPVNFAFLQTNGVPSGPPSPQLTNVNTLLPDNHTLMIDSGDTLAVSIVDLAAGLTTVVYDLTTGRTGFMVASAANGFMNTSFSDCSGTPFTFHAEYDTARIQNQIPWAALEGGVLMEQEIGHSEVCDSLADRNPFSVFYPGHQSYRDTSVFDTCVGGSEGRKAIGEGSCVDNVCRHATTQGPHGPVACPFSSPVSRATCEFADGYCFKKGLRAVTVNNSPAVATSAANQCFANRFQNGDLDFDGLSYQATAWPDGTPNHPQSFEYIGPFDRNGDIYPQVQFQTPVAGSAALCHVHTGVGCTVPPIGSAFYPFWSLSHAFGPLSHAFGERVSVCEWNFGNLLPVTTEDLGKDAQYGVPDVTRFGGTIISAVAPNPQFTGQCAKF